MENPLPLDSTPRPAYSRSKSQQILPSYEPFSRNVGGYSADMDRVSQTARAVPPFPASRSYDVHAGTPAVADAGTKTLNGGELHIAHRSSGSSKHYSSTVYAPRKRRLSHSRDDIEFWASLYAQHPVYTRKTSARYPDLSSSLALSAAKDHTKNSRVSVKIWQVLTKTDLGDHPRRKHHDHHSSLVGHQLRDMDHIQFERLPIKAPQSPATAALSSSGRPFSIVFFFTVEPTAAPARRPKSSSRTHSSEPMPVPTPITLWYLETAFTRVRTVHEHMEAMGSFLPNNGVHSGRTNGQKATPPLYIYETQTLDFKQPKDGGDTVVLDLKLQSPEGIVYAEFSYKFVKDNHRAGVDGLDSIREVVGRSHSSTRTRQQRSHSSTRTRQQRSHTSTAVPSRNERDLPRKNSLGHDDSDDDYDQAMAMDDKEPAMGMVTEEPDAGEHLMQATSQFFSKMGYWLYNSKVVQYIARDERVRTKTAFPTEDIWMLGLLYTFEHQQTTDTPPNKDQTAETEYKATKTPDTPQQPTPSAHQPTTPTPLKSEVLEGPSFPRANQPAPEGRTRYSRSTSLSHFATNSSQRSAATSYISCQEARSHSHPLSKFLSTTSTTLEDSLEQFTTTTGGLTSPSSPNLASPGSPRLSVLSDFSKLSVNAESQSAADDKLSRTLEADRVGAGTVQQEQPLSARKPSRRRMTMTGSFSRDSASNSIPSVPSGNNSSNSMSALKSLIGPGKSDYLQAAQTSSTSSTGSKQTRSEANADGNATSQEEVLRPTNSSLPTTAASALRNGALTAIHETRPTSDLSSITEDATVDNNTVFESRMHTAPEITPGVITEAAPNRERKRKTSRALAAVGSSNHITGVESMPSPVPSPVPSSEALRLRNRRKSMSAASPAPAPASVREKGYKPTRTPSLSSPSPLQSSTLLSAKRQSSIPAPPPPAKPSQQPSVFIPSPPASSPGSSLRRSWRSLSLSLVSTAKSALPLGLSSPSRTKSPGILEGQRRYGRSIHEAGFGHDYDSGDFDYLNNHDGSNSQLISLPPSIAATMARFRISSASSSSVKTPVLTREQEVLQRFLMDFQSRFWFTYRKDLARIEPSFYSCDSGWGCMMRTGQSLLAQGFVHILLGREWRVHLSQTLYTQRRYTEILDWFVDEPDRPYGIHRIAKAGLALDKRIGEWFGPATVAHALKRLSQDHQDCPAAMLVPMDGTLHVSNIVQAATHVQRASLHGAVKDKDKNGPVPSSEAMEAEVSDGPWRPVLVMIPTRFGLDKLTEKYTHNLKQLFRIPQFLGIAGGRPGRSLYFVACQGDELYYYDPHFVKPRAQPEELGTCPVPSFHCPVVRSMDIMELDPSMLLGFLIQSREELQDLMTRLDRDMEQAYPLLTIHDDRHSSEFVRSQKRTGMPKVQNQSVNGLCRDDEDMKAALDAQDRRSTSAGKHEVGEVSGHVDYAAGALNRLQNGDSEDGLSIKSLSTDEEDEEDAEGEYENGD